MLIPIHLLIPSGTLRPCRERGAIVAAQVYLQAARVINRETPALFPVMTEALGAGSFMYLLCRSSPPKKGFSSVNEETLVTTVEEKKCVQYEFQCCE